MTDQNTADVLDMREWSLAETFDDFAIMCCGHPQLNLLSDPDSFSLTQRVGRMGPGTLPELTVGSDISMDCGELCNTYWVIVLQSGRTHSVHRATFVPAGPGTAAVYAPEGVGAARWEADCRIICFKIDRCAVDEALSDALGRRVTSQIDFTPVMPTTAAPTRNWVNMLLLFKEQLFRPDRLLHQPLVGLPFADILVCGFLLAADHSHRNALTRDEKLAAPRTVRLAVEIIEEEAHLPLTVSSIGARCHVSVKFDPSMTSVASVAYRWGFTNLGRFAAAHTARYDEPPAVTLRRRAFRRTWAEYFVPDLVRKADR